jgi:major membrane immunogen (membrane-anchored lipoprotein)
MKNHPLTLFAFVLFLFTIITSCSKSDSNNNGTPTTCNFGTNTISTTSDVSVTYSASNKNSGTIASLTYLGANGAVDVTGPNLPWTVTVTVPQGKSVNITAVGTAPSGGSLYLTYAINYTNGVISNTSGCGN